MTSAKSEKVTGYDEPILWGRAHGFSDGEIAAGLGIPVELVHKRLEANLPPPVRTAAPKLQAPKVVLVEARRDPRYIAWAHAQRGAMQTRHYNEAVDR